jgi:sugar/nucleoside kinase (ribokinase family)
MSVLVIGSVAFDSIETPFGKVTQALGGAATFISLAASYFTGDVRLVGIVGSDFGEKNIQVLASRGIDLKGLEVVDGGKTFHWSGKYHFDMNRRDTLATELNVFATFNPKVPHEYQQSKFVCLGNIDPVLQKQVLTQISRPKLVVCDTMNFWIEGKLAELKETIKLTDVLIINDSEARELSKEPNLVKAARIIRGMGPKFLIIKKGEHGALLFSEGSIFSAPAFPLELVFDPTGAGDTFAGGFIGYLAKVNDISEASMRKAVLYGSTMASFCVEKFGTQRLQELSLLEIDDRYNSFLDLSRIDKE